jgi:hypothetical protein
MSEILPKIKLEPDVALGKIFIGVCIIGLLFIIISVFVVYINAINDPNCTSGNQNTAPPSTNSLPLTKIIVVIVIICIISGITSEAINYSSKPKIIVNTI